MPLLRTYVDLLAQTWVYLLTAVLAVPLVLAVTGRPQGWRAVLGRGVVWLVTVGLLIDALEVPRSFFGQLRLATALSTGPDALTEPDIAVQLRLGVGLAFLQLAAWLGGYLLAAVLFRRIDWAAVERITGCRLTGWRHWALWLVVGPLLAWPVSVAVYAARLFVMASGTQTDWPGLVAYGLPYPLALLAAGWCARGLLAPAPASEADRMETVTDGSLLARRLLLVAVVGVLSAGLFELLWALVGIMRSVLPSTTFPSMPLYFMGLQLTSLAVVCLPVLFIRHIDWQRPAALTGRPWPTAARVLALLSLGWWLAWPVRTVEVLTRVRYSPETIPALWQLAGGVLLLLVVVWLLRYRPRLVEGVED